MELGLPVIKTPERLFRLCSGSFTETGAGGGIVQADGFGKFFFFAGAGGEGADKVMATADLMGFTSATAVTLPTILFLKLLRLLVLEAGESTVI